MRRHPISTILASIVFAMVLASCSGGGRSTSSSPSTTTKAKPTTPAEPKDDPSAAPSSEGDLKVKTFNVSPWGKKVYNQEHTLYLQAKGHDFDDNASVSSYKLCVVGDAEVPLADTGVDNSPIRVVGLPRLGEALTFHQEVNPPQSFITIDDSKVTLVADNSAQTLERLLLDDGYNNGCTDLNVEMLTGDDRTVVVGFASVTSLGEWRPNGEFTWVNPAVSEEAGDDITTISYQEYVNN